MIKRDGVAIMNERTLNVKIAKETLEVIKQKGYTSPNGEKVDISDALDAALAGTTLWKSIPEIKDYMLISPVLEVTNETTAQAAVRLLASGKENLAALNFASARNPGGGFLAGAIAQEEDLSRASGLYACIKSKPIFYNENILCDDTLYTHNVIYSPKVPFFRDEYNRFLEKPYELSIISAPAPNLRGQSLNEDIVYDTLCHRAIKILRIAEAYGHKNIILGAWGCGAFGNDPKVVAEVFMWALKTISSFEHVCFAVYDNRPEAPIFNTFKNIIQG